MIIIKRDLININSCSNFIYRFPAKMPRLRVFRRDLFPQDPVCVTQYFRNYGNPRNLATYALEETSQLPVRHLHCRRGYRP